MNQKRPYVICHMMSTIDGKIDSGIGIDIFEADFKYYTKTEDRLNCKNWLLGRVTMEMFAEVKNTPLPKLSKEITGEDYLFSKTINSYMFAVDSKGVLRWKDNSIKLSNVQDKLHLVVIVTKQTPKEYLNYLQSKDISYIFGGEKEIDFTNLLVKIKEKLGIERLLLEGGGLLNGSLMTYDLIDEISLLIVPKVLNKSNTPSVFEKQTNEAVTKEFKLINFEKIENNYIWLRYKKAKN